ncbi:class I SAM-dependent methyltransferase [Spirilliplanes yamanashiensis]|uniref:Methyltransferase domain-containing protein n=1 Tax=Spirilliplanes yamanashiensis TaxID=42233 RepID=A0A8J3YC66_9ACTN|nr:class I SAM-dependent methyltransferase [Spirilliplanes yamanashiensis]MDP9816464.1 ubiquinone/menaquinone biosynthesis C-methylase UbiE [Spirilliplanes yamanashiensis]GIJ05991.1 hypothetical protein Sya03_53430 [Spirilliplanes yamanashiensis]
MGDPAEAKAGTAALFDRTAQTYDRAGADFFARAAAELVAAAAPRPGERVVDVGCGRGANLFPAALAVGPQGSAVGIDLAPAMVAATAAEARERGLTHVRVLVGDAEAPGLPDGSADLVIAAFLLFLLPDPDAAVRAYRRLLAPGGRLAVATFAEDADPDRTYAAVLGRALGEYFPPARPAVPGEPPHPMHRLRTRAAVTELLAGAGFTGFAFAEREHVLTYPDGAAFVRWLWSTGARGALEAVPADRLAEAEAAVAAEAERTLRGPAGTLALSMPGRVTIAR